MLFHVTDFARLIRFWLLKFIFRNELQKAKKYFASVLHSLALHTGLEKTRASTLLEWGWLYDILDMDFKNTQTTLRESVDSLLYWT